MSIVKVYYEILVFEIVVGFFLFIGDLIVIRKLGVWLKFFDLWGLGWKDRREMWFKGNLKVEDRRMLKL